MSVCRTCLLNLAHTNTKYSLEQTLNEISNQTEINIQSTGLQLRKMIEKCMPEMDLDICDSPVICENCYKLLMSAYKFRAICVHTEEIIYEFIEKNNLRLGESIDLSKLSNLDIKFEDDIIKEEADEFRDMPTLIPESTSDQNVNNSSNCGSDRKRTYIQESSLDEDVNDVGNVQDANNAPNHGTKRKRSEGNKGPSVSDSGTVDADRPSKNPRRKSQGNNRDSIKYHSDSDSSAEYESNGSASSETSTKESKYEKRPFTCDKCQYKASKLDLLNKHINSKCGVKIPSKFKCDKCPYKTIRQRNLKRHQLVHGGPRPFVCGVCSKGFTEKSYLKYHMFKHQPDKPLPFKCKEEGCSYASARKCDLTAHMLTHMKSDALFCRLCKKKAFPSKTELVKHEKACRKKT